jgi:hypothetical protein
MADRVFFDEALPLFVGLVRDVLGEDDLLNHFFLRDASGRITFVYTSDLSLANRAAIILGARKILPYVGPDDSAIAAQQELLDPALMERGVGDFEFIEHSAFRGFIRIVERRIVGQDWLQRPREPLENVPPIVVFGSHKGGVGRSTALAVAANAFAQSDHNVLVIDLDLEAPGLSGILLPSADLSRFGTLDYFVESGLREVDDDFLYEMIAVSPLSKGRGRIHVCPALGSVGETNPQNVLGKLSRAYLESADEHGGLISFLDRTRTLVQRLSSANRYDVIFIDARAGLNEATAAAFLGLGADVLLFGVNTPQTFSGYRYLLSYLQRFRPPESTEDDWRYRLRLVHAKASPDPKKQESFRTQAFELFADTLYDEEKQIEETSFNFDYEDSTAPHFAWPILNDSNYAEFIPLDQPDQFSFTTYERTFGPFVAALFDRLKLSKQQ